MFAALVAASLLPNTTAWEFPADIAAEQYAELRAFYEKRIALGPSRPGTREDLRRIIGAVDKLLPPQPRFTPLGQAGGMRVSLVDWPISRIGSIGPTMGFSGALIRAYGLLWEPVGAGPFPALVAIADADQPASAIAPRPGHVTFAPVFVRRRSFGQVWLEDRQWLMRLAYQTGRHIIGSEVLQASSAADFLLTRANVDRARLTIAGHGQGGLTATFAAALDDRFTAVESEGYLDDPTADWDLPEDRILWTFRNYFRNSDVARLVSPRQIVRAQLATQSWRMDPDTEARIAVEQFRQWEAFYRNAALESERIRESRWKPDYSSPEAYTRSLADKREAYLDMIGRYPAAAGPLEARSVQVYDDPGFTGHRLRIRVYDGVHAYGILLTPKGLRAGERRPVVFVQHGLGGKPEDALGVTANPRADDVYSKFGLRLAERGYIVFAPMIATQDNVERTRLIRRCHWVGMIPAGMDARKFGRVVDYLETLPYVDKARIAFYGLSYGGYTALWTGPAETRFRAVISSGHFNDWAVKTTDLTQGTAFPHYFNVLDQYNFGMLNGFNHSDLASLIAPRAFMVEMGDRDGVIVEPRSLVEREIARTLEIYRRLGIPRLGRVARFDGPHKIDGREAYPFLDEVLEWRPNR